MARCVQVAEALNACSIAARLSAGESGLGAPLGAFRGQMGCIYLFEEVLSPGGSGISRTPLHVLLHACKVRPSWAAALSG